MPKKKLVTPKSLGLVPGSKLSASYANTKTNYKVVEDRVLGFMVSGNDTHGYQVTEMLYADIYVKQDKTLHIAASWEYGEPLVAQQDEPDGTHDNYMASMLFRLLMILQERARNRKRVNVRVRKKK